MLPKSESNHQSLAAAYLYVAFFLSGVCVLSYQFCWSRILSQVVGMGTVSWVVTVCVVLLGLAGGATVAEKFAHRLARPQWFFFILELALGLYGLMSDTILRKAAALGGAWATAPFSQWAYLIDFLVQALALSPATLVMGAALPLLVASCRAERSALRATGTLYAVNTLGAALGAYLCGVYWIGMFGIRSTLWVTALVQIGLALLSLFLHKRNFFGRYAETTPPPPLEVRWAQFYVACFLLGFVALSFEVLYFRVASLYLAGTVYVVPVALCAYLLMVSLGHLASSFLKTSNSSRDIDRWLVAAISATVIVFIAPYANYLLKIGFYEMKIAPGASEWWVLASVGLVCVLMLPLLFTGGLFPLIFSQATDGQPAARLYLGRFLCFQALGNLAGALFTALWLIPTLGTVWTFRLNIGCLLAVGFLVGGARASLAGRWRNRVVLALVSLFAFCVAHSDFLTLFRDPEWRSPVAIREELPGTVFVYDSTCRFARMVRLGGEDITDIPREDDQRHLFPIDVAQGLRAGRPPKRILVIGLGRGDQALILKKAFPAAEVEGVEFLSSIVEQMRLSGSLLAEELLPSLNLHIGDGRRFLNRAKKTNEGTYDLIQIGVMNLAVGGAGNLFTQEALVIAKGLLAPQGVLLLRAFPPVLKAALAVFPGVAVAVDGKQRVAHALVTTEPLPSPKAFQENYFQTKRVFESVFKGSKLNPTEPKGSHIYLDRKGLHRMVSDVSTQTDNLPATEYFLSQPSTPGAGGFWDRREGALMLNESTLLPSLDAD